MTIAVLSVAAFALVGRGAAEEPPLGRYAAVAPSLVLDTATGKLTDSKGPVVNPAVDASGTKPGRYHAAGYVTTVVRRSWVDFMGKAQTETQVVKGFILVDTTTGNVLKSAVYSRTPLAPTDF